MTPKRLVGAVNDGAVKPIVQGIIGIGMVGGLVYCMVTQTPIPDAVLTVLGAVVGYYFGLYGKPQVIEIQGPGDTGGGEVKTYNVPVGVPGEGRSSVLRDKGDTSPNFR